MDSQHDGTSRPTIPLADGGSTRFDAISTDLPQLLDRLRSCAPIRAGQGAIPAVPGVYVLSEGDGDVPLYVGQTRDLRSRIRQHGSPWSRENQASFAFILARREAVRLASIDLAAPRKVLAVDPAFGELFRIARVRVSVMEVRYVEVDDPELRTVFEVYAAIMLGTSEYNSFETH